MFNFVYLISAICALVFIYLIIITDEFEVFLGMIIDEKLAVRAAMMMKAIISIQVFM